ncbi:MAG: hypothetical protein ABI396_02295 [Ktedonobacteraceae bacterium]
MSQQGTLTEYRKPEHLNCQLEYLGVDRYHLFVNGNWLYSFSDAGVAYDSYRDYRKFGYACTVLAGQEIAFYCTARKAST